MFSFQSSFYYRGKIGPTWPLTSLYQDASRPLGHAGITRLFYFLTLDASHTRQAGQSADRSDRKSDRNCRANPVVFQNNNNSLTRGKHVVLKVNTDARKTRRFLNAPGGCLTPCGRRTKYATLTATRRGQTAYLLLTLLCDVGQNSQST